MNGRRAKRLPEHRTGLTPAEIVDLRGALNMTQQDLAKALGLAPPTVERWERGLCVPGGLHADVLNALRLTVEHCRLSDDQATLHRLSLRISLGIGAVIFHGLVSESARQDAAPPRKRWPPPKRLRKEEWQSIARTNPTLREAVDVTGYDPKTIAKYLTKYEIQNPWE